MHAPTTRPRRWTIRIGALMVSALAVTSLTACQARLTPDGSPYVVEHGPQWVTTISQDSTGGNNREMTWWDTGASPVLQGGESRSHCPVARHSTHTWLV